jgi:hypothetical protein
MGVVQQPARANFDYKRPGILLSIEKIGKHTPPLSFDRIRVPATIPTFAYLLQTKAV